jgi:hypothetical protein
MCCCSSQVRSGPLSPCASSAATQPNGTFAATDRSIIRRASCGLVAKRQVGGDAGCPAALADAVGVPPRPRQQVLHPIRRAVPGMLGDRLAVPARQPCQQSQDECSRPAP